MCPVKQNMGKDMKKLVLALGLMAAMFMFSCTSEANHNDDGTAPTDTVETTDSSTIVREVTGVAIDGAMNSVYLKVGDDTIEFSYPDLESEHRASWEINDTLTVRYYATEAGDSVTEVINHADA